MCLSNRQRLGLRIRLGSGLRLIVRSIFATAGVAGLGVAAIALEMHVFNLDTGYQFQETLDLRDEAFPVGSVASSVIHHVGVTLWRSAEGYELFIPRGFALTLWEGFLESAEQFGVEVV